MAATCARLQVSASAFGESGYTSVVVANGASVTPAQRPRLRGEGMPITPSWSTGSPMIVPSGSAGAMCVTRLTASMIAACQSSRGLVTFAKGSGKGQGKGQGKGPGLRGEVRAGHVGDQVEPVWNGTGLKCDAVARRLCGGACAEIQIPPSAARM